MATEAEEVTSLDRVLTRVALTDDDKLEKVLQKLIPAVIGTLKSPHAKTKSKVLEILSHVNKRVKVKTNIKLPLIDLVNMYIDDQVAPMVRNFALVYAETAMERSDPADKLAAVPKLLQRISTRSPQHAAICLRMAISGLESLPPPITYSSTPPEDFVAQYQFLKSAADTKLVLQYLLKVLLYQPIRMVTSTEAVPQSPMIAMPTQPAAAPVPPLPPTPVAPPGLSLNDARTLEDKLIPGGEAAVRRKLGALSFLATATQPAADVLIHYLVASVDPNDQVSRRGDDLARRHCGIDSAKPAVDLEDNTLVQRLMDMFHGTPVTQAGVPTEAKVSPASPALRAKLVALFTKSVAAANCFPASLMAIEECMYGAGTTLRLKQAGMELAVWVIKHAADHQLKAMGPAMLQGLLRALDEAPPGESTPAQLMRGFGYQAVGQLATRMPELVSERTDIAERFFSALETEPSGVKAVVQEATSALAIAFKGLKGARAAELEELLQRSITHHKDTVRLSAVQWARRLFPFRHIPARYICILGAGDSKMEVREEARKGLMQGRGSEQEKADGAEVVRFPSLKAVLAHLRTMIPRLKATPDPNASLPITQGSYLALITFLQACKKQSDTSATAPPSAAATPSTPAAGSDAEMTDVEDDGQDVNDSELSGVVPVAFTKVLEHALCRDASSEVAVAALQALVTASFLHFEEMVGRLSHKITLLRSFLAHTNITARETAGKLLACAVAALSTSDVEALVSQLSSVLKLGEEKQHKFEERDGCIFALGFILAQTQLGAPTISEAVTHAATSALVAVLSQPKDHQLSASAALALGHVSLRGSLPLEQPTALEGIVQRVVELMEDKEVKVVGRTVAAAGYLCGGMPQKAVLDPLLKGLFKQSFSKAEEIQFSIGEALALAFAAPPVPVDTILRSNFLSLAAAYNIYKGAPGEAAMEIDGPPVSGTGLGAAAAEEGDRVAAQDAILEKLVKDMVVHTRLEVRCAASVWLVSLLTYCGSHPRISALLPDIQRVLTPLLGDSNELTQEMAGKGVSLVYNLGGEATRTKLVEDLVTVLQGGAKGALVGAKVTAETRVLDDSGNSGLSTYKELCSLATDIGQPELVYRFMDLAHHQAAMQSKRGAAFGVAGIAKLAGEQLGPHVAALVPKLYRYQYDPNPRVQDAMTHIWRALVDDPKKAINENFEAIVKELLKEVGGRLWRNRQASCAALADLLQARGWTEVGPYLTQVWTMALRAMDDIKDSVRTAGAGLCRSVRGLTLRLVDPKYTTHSEAEAAVSAMIPLLLDQGVHSTVPEVRGAAIDTLSKAVKAAGPQLMRPHMAPLVSALLESLSSLEDSRLNYIEQHATRLGLDNDRLENARFAASRSSPMWDTLEMAARYADEAALTALVPELCSLVRKGVGINTRAGTARFITMLANRVTSAIRPHTQALLRALMIAARAERSSAARRGFAAAAADLCRFAAPKRVEKVVAESLEMYSEGDKEVRLTGGLLLRELLRASPQSFQAHGTEILPVSFAAKMDEDAEVAAAWKEIWEEGVASESAAVRLYLPELVEIVSKGLGAQQWGRKKAAAQALESLADVAGDTLAPHASALAKLLLAEAGGRLWEGKENVLAALGAVCKACSTAVDKDPGADKVIDALLAALERKKGSFKAAALACLETAIKSFQKDVYTRVSPPLLEACAEHSKVPETPSTSASAPSDMETDAEAAPKPLPLTETFRCLTAAWKGVQAETVASSSGRLAEALAKVLLSHPPWAAQLEGLVCVREFVRVALAKAGADLDHKSLLGSLVPGVAAPLTDSKVQQVRTEALGAIQDILAATSNGRDLSPEVLRQLLLRVDHTVDHEPSAALKADAVVVQRALQAVLGGASKPADAMDTN